MSHVIAILGPTASGKSALAMQLACKHNGEIVSCDSAQIYRGMDIGTAKPTRQDRAEIPHHMLDIADPRESYTAARYADEALQCIEDIRQRGKAAVVCGGTGFYWRSLYRGLSDAPKGDLALRARLDLHDGQDLHDRLAVVDPVSAANIPVNNKRRVIRALEVFELSGKPLSSFEAHGAPRFDAEVLALRCDRAVLYDRIERRVDAMIESGLLDEIRGLLDNSVSPSSQAMQAIGYKEFIGVIQNKLPLEEAVSQCKQNTRRYAKRQMTWLARENDMRWIDV
ncbi:MAG: tRNA (adenosine(37)-N6)-dimethylallyltransferase MiaA [Oscillospiraceae bacterium]|nr:tRNA (adenosine(37)-N6)-dimethylallyltransferase MiaA [Oscillospiraceae bacterium]